MGQKFGVTWLKGSGLGISRGCSQRMAGTGVIWKTLYSHAWCWVGNIPGLEQLKHLGHLSLSPCDLFSSSLQAASGYQNIHVVVQGSFKACILRERTRRKYITSSNLTSEVMQHHCQHILLHTSYLLEEIHKARPFLSQGELDSIFDGRIIKELTDMF